MVEGGLDVNLIACAEKPSDVDQIYGVFPRADADVRNSSGFSIRFLEHHCDNLGGCASRCGHPPPPPRGRTRFQEVNYIRDFSSSRMRSLLGHHRPSHPSPNVVFDVPCLLHKEI